MNSIDRPKPNVDRIERISGAWQEILIVCFVLFVGIMFFVIVNTRTSYQYRIAVNGNHYQCNVIERGNPTYLKDCWQGNDITIYDPVNMVVLE